MVKGADRIIKHASTLDLYLGNIFVYNSTSVSIHAVTTNRVYTPPLPTAFVHSEILIRTTTMEWSLR